MAFNFFGFKKRSDIQDVEAKDVTKPSLVEVSPEVVANLFIITEPAPVPTPEIAVAESTLFDKTTSQPSQNSVQLAVISALEVKSNFSPVAPIAVNDSTTFQDINATKANSPIVDAPKAPETNQLLATREDVTAAFKIFLGRMPESEKVIATWVGVKPQAILVDFLKSPEFLNHVQKSQFILALAKKILDDQRKLDVPKND